MGNSNCMTAHFKKGRPECAMAMMLKTGESSRRTEGLFHRLTRDYAMAGLTNGR